jgi:SecD/SecF fusion protein
VTNAILDGFGDALLIRRSIEYEESESDSIKPQPITEATQAFGQTEVDLSDYVGGAAFVIKGMNPPVSVPELTDRLWNMRFQPEFEKYQWRDFEVFPLKQAKGRQGVYTDVLVAVFDPNYNYSNYEENVSQWQNEFAAREAMWVKAALEREQTLEKITQFAPQVAARAQIQAWVAIVLALIIMILYIWIRFGNVRFGLGVIAALIHDVSIVIGCVAISAFLADTAVGSGLMIDNFRINLPMIAAFLTIIGYSANDTIVVFDRIRENRGKRNIITRRLINDSINQIMSRTILTSLTTWMVVIIMYIFGGPGIHGFNYAFLIGIIVGTYSSIAIASPLLLLGLRSRVQAESG